MKVLYESYMSQTEDMEWFGFNDGPIPEQKGDGDEVAKKVNKKKIKKEEEDVLEQVVREMEKKYVKQATHNYNVIMMKARL